MTTAATRVRPGVSSTRVQRQIALSVTDQYPRWCHVQRGQTITKCIVECEPNRGVAFLHHCTLKAVTSYHYYIETNFRQLYPTRSLYMTQVSRPIGEAEYKFDWHHCGMNMNSFKILISPLMIRLKARYNNCSMSCFFYNPDGVNRMPLTLVLSVIDVCGRETLCFIVTVLGDLTPKSV